MKRKARRINTSKLKNGPETVDDADVFHRSNGFNIPPDDMIVKIYFDQKDVGHIADDFIKTYKKNNWKTASGKKISNWKVLASDWIFNYQQSKKFALRTSKFCTQSI